MPSVTLTFAALLQDQRRLDMGLAFGDVLEEVIQAIPFHKVADCGETIQVPRVVGTSDITALSGFRGATVVPSAGTPTGSSVSFNLRRLDSVSQDDITILVANRQPNDLTRADQSARRCSVKRALATVLMTGIDNDTTGGFLGWENMSPGTGTRTDVTFIGASASQTLETLLVLDDTCKTGELGDRASAFVTTARGRRNIEIAAQSRGFELTYRRVHCLMSEVPFYRGRPILVSSGLQDDGALSRAPTYAVDFTKVFMVSSSGTPEDYCIETKRIPLTSGANYGPYHWFHGTCVVLHPAALVRGVVTTTLSS